MLTPKKVKWRKQQKGKMRGKAYRGNTITFGEYGLQATTCGYISNRQIEAARITISRETKTGGNVWIKVFPDKSLTKKPAEVRMGKGKGAPEQWVAVIKPGRIMFEVGGISEEAAKRGLKMAAYKLSVKAKVVKKEDVNLKG
jgi:large subunit ribosomal protein L16